jgi:hypothetical protein
MKLKIVKDIYLGKKSGEEKVLQRFLKNFSMTFKSQVALKLFSRHCYQVIHKRLSFVKWVLDL